VLHVTNLNKQCKLYTLQYGINYGPLNLHSGNFLPIQRLEKYYYIKTMFVQLIQYKPNYFQSLYKAGTGTGFFATAKPSLRTVPILRYLIQLISLWSFVECGF